MKIFRVRFYRHVSHDNERKPCKRLPHSFASAKQAEEVAINMMPAITAEFGDGAGYAILDSRYRVVARGPSQSES